MFAPLRLLTSSGRVKARGWTVSRARACARQRTCELPPPAASVLRSSSTCAALSSEPGPGRKEQHLVTFRHEGMRSSHMSSSHRKYEDVIGRSSSSRAPAATRRTAGVRFDVWSGCRLTSCDDGFALESDGTRRDALHSCIPAVEEPSGDENASASSSSSCPHKAPAATAAAAAAATTTLSALTAAPQPYKSEVALRLSNQKHSNKEQPPATCKRRLRSASSPIRTSAAATAALACARGVGGRLGSPLGSSCSALEKRLGSSHPAPPSVSNATKKAKLSDTAGDSSAPGSRFFPPSVSVSAANCGRGSPVVFEMVQDAADDEEDAIRRSSGTSSSTDGDGQEGERRELGWDGFTLYRYTLRQARI